ncbi:MAG: bifunctional precorrin-2 dehydrogenase/sirohydrochlorin ferrochelatase [Phycisphaeraceae bacterium]|nr:bifunctional precorrin-2 dehydrogenase/sirohydrochlorin ferrochelatase [Phycisphaeraceae bacterium]
MEGLPVILRVQGRLCVVIGGGGVALRRARSLLEAGAKVRVVAPDVEKEFAALPVELWRRGYQKGDLQGACLAVIATNDPQVNQQAANDARELGVLINRVDDPESGDFTVPAHRQNGPITLAVHTGGISAAAAGRIVRELESQLDPDWPKLLEIIAPYRAKLKEQVSDVSLRQQALSRLTDEQAMRTFKQHGGTGLIQWCESILAQP